MDIMGIGCECSSLDTGEDVLLDQFDGNGFFLDNGLREDGFAVDDSSVAVEQGDSGG
jgi:hypothetical protein